MLWASNSDEARRIQKAQVAGLEAFGKLPLTERLKRLMAIGIVDDKGDLTPAYGGEVDDPTKSPTQPSAAKVNWECVEAIVGTEAEWRDRVEKKAATKATQLRD